MSPHKPTTQLLLILAASISASGAALQSSASEDVARNGPLNTGVCIWDAGTVQPGAFQVAGKPDYVVCCDFTAKSAIWRAFGDRRGLGPYCCDGENGTGRCDVQARAGVSVDCSKVGLGLGGSWEEKLGEELYYCAKG
jgi:hypothetical protein